MLLLTVGECEAMPILKLWNLTIVLCSASGISHLAPFGF
jgi:hypothetical protein